MPTDALRLHALSDAAQEGDSWLTQSVCILDRRHVCAELGWRPVSVASAALRLDWSLTAASTGGGRKSRKKRDPAGALAERMRPTALPPPPESALTAERPLLSLVMEAEHDGAATDADAGGLVTLELLPPAVEAHIQDRQLAARKAVAAVPASRKATVAATKGTDQTAAIKWPADLPVQQTAQLRKQEAGKPSEDLPAAAVWPALAKYALEADPQAQLPKTSLGVFAKQTSKERRTTNGAPVAARCNDMDFFLQLHGHQPEAAPTAGAAAAEPEGQAEVETQAISSDSTSSEQPAGGPVSSSALFVATCNTLIKPQDILRMLQMLSNRTCTAGFEPNLIKSSAFLPCVFSHPHTLCFGQRSQQS